MKSIIAMILIAVGCFIIPAEIICAEEADTNASNRKLPVPQHWTPITSHHRNFIVTDMPRRDSLEVAIWAESARQRLVDWATTPIPGDQATPMVIAAERRPGEAQGRVLKAQGYTPDGRRQQEITMINPAAMDQEDVLESICWLLLNQWIHVRQSTEDRINRPGKYPDWFAVGVAQNLYPELKERNIQEIRTNEANGDYQPASTIFDQVFLPPGRWPEKARAGLVVAWLADLLTPSVLMTKTADHLARHKPLDIPAMLEITGLRDQRSINMAWDVWMSRQEQRMIPGVLSDDYRDVERILELRPEDVGLVYPYPLPDDRLTAEILIQNRDQAWAKSTSREVALKLREEAIGKSPDLLACIKNYLAFFDLLAPPKVEKNEDPAKSVSSAADLEQRWNAAEKTWNEYVTRQAARTALIDHYKKPESQEPATVTNDVKNLMDRWDK